MNKGESVNALRDVSRLFARLQRNAFSCCKPRSEYECLVLIELLGSNGLPINELASKTGTDAPWMSRTVEKLRGHGFVERLEDPNDRRQVRVRLTKAGTQNAKRLNEALNSQAEEVLSNFPSDQQRLILDALVRLSRALRGAQGDQVSAENRR